MSQRELQRYRVISMAVEGKLAVKDAGEALGLSPRQVKRLKKAVRTRGAKGVTHGNRGRPSPRCLPPSVRDQVVHLAREDYRGFNDTQMWEKLVDVEGLRLSRDTLRVILREEGIRWAAKRRVPRHRSRRERKPQEGMMLQLDGSPHAWLEDRGPALCLLGAVDDATGIVPWASFEEVEDTAGYLRLLREIITRHGIPLSVYTDRHSVFTVTRKAWTVDEELAGRQQPTQVARALEELGIELILAGSPQAKGRVERLFGTLQDRLVSELRLAGISSREDANAFLHTTFLPSHNRRFSVPASNTQKAYRLLPPELKLDTILCLSYVSVVGNDNTVHIGRRIIDIPPGPGSRSYAKARVTTKLLLDGSWHVYHHDTLIATTPPSHEETPVKTINHPRPGSKKHLSWVQLHSKPNSQGVTDSFST